jgi:hypothetical protein
MPATASPTGLLPVWHPSGQVRRIAYDNILLSTMNVPIYQNTPVKFVIGTGGSIAGVTVPTGQMVIQPVDLNSVAFCGVFAGVEYQDANGRGQESSFWGASTALYTGTVARVYLIGTDDPLTVYQIQFDGALNTGSNLYSFAGKQAVFNSTDVSATAPAGSVGAGGLSACRASATLTSSGSQGQLRIVSNPQGQPNNAPNDAFPNMYVQIARHQFGFGSVITSL